MTGAPDRDHPTYIGVSQIRGGGWRARVREQHLGVFMTAEQAARARDAVALQVFGAAARLNFPDHDHRPGDGSWWEYDARGIELCRVCDKCRAEKLRGYRREVLTDPQYEADDLGDDELSAARPEEEPIA